MPGHPAIYADWRAAKKAAAVLAAACRADLLQVNRHPRIIIGGRVIDVTTWLEAWSCLHRIRADQVKPKR